MKITFPHMGDMAIVLKAGLDKLGVDCLVPPGHSKRSLDLGVKYSPELACLPFKLNLGNLIEALQRGANVIIAPCDDGPCRLGYYGTVHYNILKKLGYEFDLIHLWQRRPMEWVRVFRRLKPGVTLEQLVSSFRFGYKKLRVLDDSEKRALRTRPVEIIRGATDILVSRIRNEVEEASTFHALKRIRSTFDERFSSIPMNEHDGDIRIGIVGEIYVVLEPFVNFHLERKLGEMGVHVERRLWLSDSVKDALHLQPFSRYSKRRAIAISKKYMKVNVGAECNVSIGECMNFAKEGVDGAVHLMPFTCSPEAIARTIFQKLSKDLSFPILSVVLDEHTAETGLLTRLEAFVDLLRRKRIAQTGLQKG